VSRPSGRARSTRLDDGGALSRADRHDVRSVLAGFPEQCRRAVDLVPSPLPVVERPRVVIVAGMGGSAAGGDIIAACAAETQAVPIVVHRGYGLPATAASGALVVVSSYSGETAEVLSALEAARERRVAVVTLTAGGAVARIAAERGLPRVTLPPGLMPRMALGYLLLPLVGLLARCGVPVATTDHVTEAIDVVTVMAKELAPERPAADNEAKQLALVLGRRLPVVYGGQVTGPAAYRWKTDLEENAKTFALAGALPEVTHNEIEAWRRPGARTMQLILLRDAGEPPAINRRFDVLRELAGPAAGGVSEAWSRGRGTLARLLSLVYLGQWTSYYLAVRREVDPWTIPLLDEVKRRMAPAPDGAPPAP
jgi:glucose/mannose-6-phosphate isomerase